LIESRQAYGIAQNANTKLLLGHMMSISKDYKARIQISFEAPAHKSTLIAKCIYSALNPDAEISFDSGAITRISVHIRSLSIEIETDDIPSLRAIVNSYLRLVNTSYKCIVS
jgi:tRNA threonylcarbamoyladenosine modification (KEOPS) complex  Pcc1 subunit